MKVECSSCRLHDLCLPGEVDANEVDYVDQIVKQRRKVLRGEQLYHLNAPFNALFAVRSGFLKSTLLTPDGRDQVIDFSMMGDTLGFDGIESDHHTRNVIALEDSEVCVIPFSALQGITQRAPVLQKRIYKLMSREIIREQAAMLTLGSMRSEERIATFLLNFSQQCVRRGYAEHEFNLRMTREDIGSYLGLTLETVSRGLARFQKLGVIEISKKHVRILDIAQLQKVVQEGSTS